MGNGFQFIDIILFAMIAAFLVLRLRGVLGRRDGHEGDFPNVLKRNQKDKKDQKDKGDAVDQNDDNVVNIVDKFIQDNDPLADLGAEMPDKDTPEYELAVGLGDVQEADPTFNQDQFVDGAGAAFDIILGGFSAGDKDALRPLLNDEVYNNFLISIEDRERAGHTMEDTLVGVKSVQIVEAYMEGRDANVTVKFVSEQVNVIRDENGDVVDGNTNLVIEVTDFWTFGRDTRSRNPNWALVATRSLD